MTFFEGKQKAYFQGRTVSCREGLDLPKQGHLGSRVTYHLIQLHICRCSVVALIILHVWSCSEPLLKRDYLENKKKVKQHFAESSPKGTFKMIGFPIKPAILIEGPKFLRYTSMIIYNQHCIYININIQIKLYTQYITVYIYVNLNPNAKFPMEKAAV